MRIIRIRIYKKGGTLQIWPEKLLIDEPTDKLFPRDDDADLAREIVSSTVDIDTNCIRAIDFYSSEEDRYVYEDSGNRVVAAEEIRESDT
jgi:hypothetical protein